MVARLKHVDLQSDLRDVLAAQRGDGGTQPGVCWRLPGHRGVLTDLPLALSLSPPSLSVSVSLSSPSLPSLTLTSLSLLSPSLDSLFLTLAFPWSCSLFSHSVTLISLLSIPRFPISVSLSPRVLHFTLSLSLPLSLFLSLSPSISLDYRMVRCFYSCLSINQNYSRYSEQMTFRSHLSCFKWRENKGFILIWGLRAVYERCGFSLLFVT